MPAPPVEHVAAGIAFERVVEARAGQVFDAGQGIAFGVAAVAGPVVRLTSTPAADAA